MKTLDEVIKAYEVCHASVLSCEGCPYDNGETWRDDDCYVHDMLHYLKEYQTLQYGYVKAMADLEDNPPLTWEQLKQMEGKPVWVETEYYSSRWAVITDVDDVRIRFVGKQLLDSEIVQEMGNTWQAYRKEKDEANRIDYYNEKCPKCGTKVKYVEGTGHIFVGGSESYEDWHVVKCNFCPNCGEKMERENKYGEKNDKELVD